jgi:hypothetical protein
MAAAFPRRRESPNSELRDELLNVEISSKPGGAFHDLDDIGRLWHCSHVFRKLGCQ